ncbi:MAG TPA: hypothetical protein PKA06_13590, partial [Gemmatales bacterium]|nr:hypothetical protein [Gemmatales bacterium]
SRYVSIMWFGFWLLGKVLFIMLFISSGYAEWAHLANFTKNVQRIQEAVMDTEGAWQQIDRMYKIAQDAIKAKTGMQPSMVPQVLDQQRRGGFAARREAAGDGRVLLNVIVENDKVYIRSSDIRSIYPWWWSAVTLFVLGVVSLCILLYRVKTLDRLR